MYAKEPTLVSRRNIIARIARHIRNLTIQDPCPGPVFCLCKPGVFGQG